jgi:dimethylargininase
MAEPGVPSASLAIVRPPSSALAGCELTYLGRSALDVARSLEQHCGYVAALQQLGVQIEALPAEPALPDATFVEDVAVVFDELAVITRPGVVSRRPEGAAIATVLATHRSLGAIEAPGTLEGGDVLQIGRQIFVGATGRTNQAGREQLARLLEPLGYQVTSVAVGDSLHLKTGCTYLGGDTLLVNPAWIDSSALRSTRAIEVHPDEPFAANTLPIGHVVLMAASCPRTIDRVLAQGFAVQPVPIDELMKAEAGLTCLSLLLNRIIG